MERVCREIAESLQTTIRTLDDNLRRTDTALAGIAEEKRLTQNLLRELRLGR